VECPALALKARLDLYMAAADAVLDTGIHSLGWNQEEAQREFAGMLEAIGSETRVALSHGRASLQTIETNDNIAFSDVARAAGSPGRAAVAFAAWSEIARLRDEASEASSGSWSESSFHDILVGHGALPLVVAEKLVDAAFGS
jgi:uncharacterized protein (DUF885 family)